MKKLYLHLANGISTQRTTPHILTATNFRRCIPNSSCINTGQQDNNPLSPSCKLPKSFYVCKVQLCSYSIGRRRCPWVQILLQDSYNNNSGRKESTTCEHREASVLKRSDKVAHTNMRQLTHELGSKPQQNHRQASNSFQIKREDEGQVRDQGFENRYTKNE